VAQICQHLATDITSDLHSGLKPDLDRTYFKLLKWRLAAALPWLHPESNIQIVAELLMRLVIIQNDELNIVFWMRNGCFPP
jgi:hypothetical protein